MTAQPLDNLDDEIRVRVPAGDTPPDMPTDYDIVGIEGDAEYDYFILRRRNA